MNPNQELADLMGLGIERTRKAILLVTQLTDDPYDAAAIITVAAADLIKGAAKHLEYAYPDKNYIEALDMALRGLLATIDKESISELRKMRPSRRAKKK